MATRSGSTVPPAGDTECHTVSRGRTVDHSNLSTTIEPFNLEMANPLANCSFSPVDRDSGVSA